MPENFQRRKRIAESAVEYQKAAKALAEARVSLAEITADVTVAEPQLQLYFELVRAEALENTFLLPDDVHAESDDVFFAGWEEAKERAGDAAVAFASQA